MKPMLASDFDEKKLRFPLMAQPKIDGVRGLNLTGALTGRSLKAHANVYTTGFFSKDEYLGLDGEMAAGAITDQELCRNTTSALNSIKGEPYVHWYAFDLLLPATLDMPYQARYTALQAHMDLMHSTGRCNRVTVVPSHHCKNLEDLLQLESAWLDQGYEGAIIRDPMGAYKQGRSTVREGGLLRIKRFMEEDALVLSVVEGQVNGNEAKTNELGRTERSSHQENMTPNGMVGTLICRVLKDVPDARTGAILLSAGQEITVSAGSMPHEERVKYFKEQDLIVGERISFRFFPKGIKNKPRFPTYKSIRSRCDR